MSECLRAKIKGSKNKGGEGRGRLPWIRPNLVPRAFPLKFLREKPWGRGWIRPCAAICYLILNYSIPSSVRRRRKNF